MMFEQHPELFFTLVAAIGGAGGYLGARIREFINHRKESKWQLQKQKD